MKKKHERKYIINSNDWTKTKVSLLEANQNQQTIIINFFEKSDLSDYSICICPLSPLLGTPEDVTQILCDFSQAGISANNKLYVVFSNIEFGPALDEYDNLFISKISDFPFALKDNEAVGLLKKITEDDTWNLVDWVIPIIDEVIPLEVLKEASALSKHEDTDKKDDSRFMRKRENATYTNNLTTDFLYLIKPKFWLFTFIFVISFLEIFSLISFTENIWSMILEAILLSVKNIFIGNVVYNFIISDKKISRKTIINSSSTFIKLSIVFFALAFSLKLFSYPVLIATLIVFIVVTIFSFLISKQRTK